MHPMMRLQTYCATSLLTGMVVAVAAQTTVPDGAVVYFMDPAETFGGIVAVAASPPKEPMAVQPRLVMSVRNSTVRFEDALRVVAIGVLAWRTKESVTVQVQALMSTNPLSASPERAEIAALRRRVLATKTIGPNDIVSFKELAPYGYPDIVARLGPVRR